MEKNTNAIATLGIAVVILFSGVAPAADREASEPSAFGPPPRGGSGQHMNRPPQNASHLLGKAMHDSMAREALIELTGNEVDAVPSDMDVRCMRDVLSVLGIEQEAFQAAMDARLKVQVNKAVECGMISREQASVILEFMEHKETGHNRVAGDRNQQGTER